MRRHSFGEQEWSAHVHEDRLISNFQRRLFEWCAAGIHEASVVHQNVDAAETADHAIDGALDGDRVGGIGFERGRFSSKSFDVRHDRLCGLRAFLFRDCPIFPTNNQPPPQNPPHPSACPSHQRRFSGQVAHTSSKIRSIKGATTLQSGAGFRNRSSGMSDSRPASAITHPTHNGARNPYPALIKSPPKNAPVMMPSVITEVCTVLTRGRPFAALMTRVTMAGFMVTPTRPMPTSEMAANGLLPAKMPNIARKTTSRQRPMARMGRVWRSASFPTTRLPTTVATP